MRTSARRCKTDTEGTRNEKDGKRKGDSVKRVEKRIGGERDGEWKAIERAKEK